MLWRRREQVSQHANCSPGVQQVRAEALATPRDWEVTAELGKGSLVAEVRAALGRPGAGHE